MTTYEARLRTLSKRLDEAVDEASKQALSPGELSPEEVSIAAQMATPLESIRQFKRDMKARAIENNAASETERQLARAFGFDSVAEYRKTWRRT